MASILRAYAASSNQTVTNLNSRGASATWIDGWGSGAIDNTSNLYEDYRVTAKITVAAAGLSAGEIRLYLVGPLDDSNFPSCTTTGTLGTEGQIVITDTEMRDAICLLGAVTQTDTTNSDVYFLDCPSASAVFGGNLPKKFVVFITQSTGAALAASGNQVTVTGSYRTVA